jgi:flagellin
MAAFINTNVASMNSQRNLNSSQTALTTSLQRLSSGLRINSAKDDAAGLAITERMTSQIRGADQAARNANDGISLAQTAEGDLSQIGNNLQRIRELAVQASNGSNSASDRASMNAEATQLISEIDRVATNSSFNGVKLLDGSFSSQSFQVGANNSSNDRITIDSISSAKGSALGVGSGSSYKTDTAGSAVTTAALAAGGLVINGYNVGASAKDGVSYANSDGSAIAKAAAINAVSGQTNVTASVNATKVAGTTVIAQATTAGGYDTAIAAGDIKINGVDIGALAGAGSKAERGSQMAAAINAKSAQTGVTATFDTSTGAVGLAAADGRNITIDKSVNKAADDTSTGLTTGIASITAGSKTLTGTVSLTSSGKDGITVANGASNVSTGGADAGVTAGGNTAAGDLKINGLDIGVITAGATAAATAAAAVTAINGTAGLSAMGIVASVSGNKVVLTRADGGAIDIVAKAQGTTTTGLSSSDSKVAAGGAGATASGISVGTKAATATAGAGMSSLDLTTASGAQAALTTIDSAISTVNSSRASLGAYQNRFASVVSSLQTSSENLSASRSRIQDTDFARETASLTRGQILQQAGTAMLAQANSLPNGVLALLRG